MFERAGTPSYAAVQMWCGGRKAAEQGAFVCVWKAMQMIDTGVQEVAAESNSAVRQYEEGAHMTQ